MTLEGHTEKRYLGVRSATVQGRRIKAGDSRCKVPGVFEVQHWGLCGQSRVTGPKGNGAKLMTGLDGTLDFIEGDGEILGGLQEKGLFRELLGCVCLFVCLF